MCIFTQPVLAVNNTKIFARLSGDGTQFLAYQMSYKSNDQNAMILPIPVKQPANEGYLNFIDLEGYGDFFDDLASGFPYARPTSIGCSDSHTASKSALRVFAVGNYIASFVPTLSDFDRLDTKFKLPSEIWERIPGYENFGFAVFQLAAGSLKPHPMAFEFQTENDELFFPTIHIHDGEIHKSEKFDHVLYMQHAGLDSIAYGYQNSDVEDRSTGLVRSKYKASQFSNVDKSVGLLNGNLLVHRKIVRGKFPNVDTFFRPPGNPVKPSFNFRSLLPFTPWLIAIAGVGWFFNRRSKIKRLRELNLPEAPDENAP